MVDRSIPVTLTSSSGTLGYADEIELDTSSLTGALSGLSSQASVQAMAAVIDGGFPGTTVSIDDSTFSSVDADNAQEVASELERLFNIVASSQPGTTTPGLSGPFIPFTQSVNVDTAGVSLYAGNIALYARSDNARVNFILPTDAEITASGVATNEQVEITVLNQAGTARFDTGFTPTNTVVIDVGDSIGPSDLVSAGDVDVTKTGLQTFGAGVSAPVAIDPIVTVGAGASTQGEGRVLISYVEAS